ncbi:MAG: hypothetical protein AMXMBFR6_05960 [Betaproteobacteria bacterium]|nr:NUDIX hydrolase [Rhodocyclaceae bacterium]MCG3186251.1 hypothetical protein [Rhodocyclaceae bacterium]
MNFCSQCGNPVTLRIPPGDNLPRHICVECATIHYQNPKIVVGAVAAWGDRVLLCRRAIEPRHGYWTLPAGFMENGESTADAAARETLEEACARIEIDALFSVLSIPHISQVHMLYRGRLIEQSFAPGEESLEVALFAEADIPWDQLAFRTISRTLKLYFEDRRKGRFEIHGGEVIPPP